MDPNIRFAFFIAGACLIIKAIFMIAQKLRHLRKLTAHASKFPGPPTIPVIGNGLLFTGSFEDILITFMKLGGLYPSPYRMWMINYLTFTLNKPEQLKVVLQSPNSMDKGELFNLIRPWLGEGLLTASGKKWKVHRKLIQPTFSPTILKSFLEVFTARSEMMAKKIEQHLNGPEFHIHTYLTQWALHTLCGTTMGVNLGGHTDRDNFYQEAVLKVIGSVCKRVMSPWLYPDFIFYRTQLGKEQRRCIKFLHNFSHTVIQTKKKELLEEINQPRSVGVAEGESNYIPQKKIFLDHLLEASREGKIFSDEELRQEVDTIIVTGSDTTAVTSSYVLLMLASHPDIQEKVYQELCEIHADDDSEELSFTWDKLARMTYMERVIKETMRIFPIVPVIIRDVVEDLVVGEDTFPAGSMLLLSIIELHRNEKYWPDPMKFDPDRFLPEAVEKRNPYWYLPFSGGPRNCIGYKYGMMSTKILLSTILRKYVVIKDDIIPLKDIRLKWEFVLRPVNPIKLRIESRNRKAGSV